MARQEPRVGAVEKFPGRLDGGVGALDDDGDTDNYAVGLRERKVSQVIKGLFSAFRVCHRK